MNLTRRSLALSLAVAGAGTALAGCAYTVKLDVQPITIYAKLDADVRVRLDEDVKALIQQNPNLF
ncbi:YnbE family lipoprotein [Phenylobacterium sp.]|uniref:YnbE family lipoprotein n=1 Tax=Phenylobacterium sp. TaxID=1871053 RepID=UPI0035B2E7CA